MAHERLVYERMKKHIIIKEEIITKDTKNTKVGISFFRDFRIFRGLQFHLKNRKSCITHFSAFDLNEKFSKINIFTGRMFNNDDAVF